MKARKPLTKNARLAIKTKLGEKCRWCGTKHDIQIHHIDENPSNNAAGNLELVCYRCHKWIHSDHSKTRTIHTDQCFEPDDKECKGQYMFPALEYLIHCKVHCGCKR